MKLLEILQQQFAEQQKKHEEFQLQNKEQMKHKKRLSDKSATPFFCKYGFLLYNACHPKFLSFDLGSRVWVDDHLSKFTTFTAAH